MHEHMCVVWELSVPKNTPVRKHTHLHVMIWSGILTVLNIYTYLYIIFHIYAYIGMGEQCMSTCCNFMQIACCTSFLFA